MNLDIQTLFVVMFVSMVSLSLALPLLMGWQVSAAARCFQAAMALQTVGWCALLFSRQGPEALLSTLGMAGLAGGQALTWEALRGWLGRRPGRALIWTAAVLMPLGYGLGFASYPFRVGWSNFGLALQMALVCLALAWPATTASRRWRALMGLCLAALAVATVARGVLGAFFTEAYPTFRTPHPVNLAFALLAPVALLLTTVSLLVAWREEAERDIATLARTDGLTGLLNRRAFTEQARALLAQARRHRDALSVLMIDLDHFKQINDSHGHDAGDRALRLVAQVVQSQMRRGDLACRWGGEEFCIVLPRTGAEAAQAFDQRLRDALAAQSPLALDVLLGFSSGLAARRDGDAELELILHRADVALYAAKHAGRGRLVNADALPPPPEPLQPLGRAAPEGTGAPR